MNQYKYIDLELVTWLSNVKSIGLEENDIKNMLEENFPYLYDNFQINIAKEIDFAYSGLKGQYMKNQYNNPKKGDPITIYDIDYKVEESGLYTFSVYKPNFDPYLEPIG